MSVRDIEDDGGAGALGVCGSEEARWVGVGGVMVVVFKRAHTDKHVNRRARDENHACQHLGADLFSCGPEWSVRDRPMVDADSRFNLAVDLGELAVNVSVQITVAAVTQLSPLSLSPPFLFL